MSRKIVSRLLCAVLCAAMLCGEIPSSAAENTEITVTEDAEDQESTETENGDDKSSEAKDADEAETNNENDDEKVDPDNEDDEENEDPENDDAEEITASVIYRGYVQNIGWAEEVSDGDIAGTTGQGLRMEGMTIAVDSALQGGITYRSHVQNVGWQDWVSDGAYTGTKNKSLRMEAIQIKLTGEMESAFDVYYRVHVQNIGWLGWAENGEISGTVNSSLRIESLQIMLIEKGMEPELEDTGYDPSYKMTLSYRSHVQNIGWENNHSNNEISGSVGQGLRLEGFVIALDTGFGDSIQYRSHVQNIGWQDWKSGNTIAGTVGQSLREEAIQIRLTGTSADVFDIYYRVHIQNYGWLDWAKNGEPAGSEGYGLRLEAIQIEIIPKGNAAPGSMAVPYHKFEKFSNPCPNMKYISDEFGGRVSPGGIGSTNHKGRDYAAYAGTNILAAADGVVCEAGYNRYRGYYLIVEHWGGFKTVYQHMPRCELAVGTKVSRGQVIGHVGSTGVSTGPHLHFEVRVNNVPVDPRLYL